MLPFVLLLLSCAPPVAPLLISGDGTVDVPGVDDSTLPSVVINEVMADNASTLQEGDGSRPDWVELYNASDADVPLADLSLVDEGGDAWKGETGVLEPGGHLLLRADEADIEGHTPFAIGKDGEHLSLSVRGVEVDRVFTGELPTDVALARVPDGGAWHPTVEPTPGWMNLAAGTDSSDPREGVFQDHRVLQVQFTLSDASYSALSRDGRTQVEASMTIDGIWYPSVGLSLKGSGSYQAITGKSAFKVDLNDFGDTGAEFRGLDHLTFNNGVTWDPTWTHEYITYSLFREIGIPAPRVGWARISLNGADYGLYMNVETHDHDWLELWFQDPEGDLWEGQGDFYSTTNVETYFHLECGAGDVSRLEEVAGIIAGSATDLNVERLGQVIDLDEFMTYMAGESVTLHWDGYESPNNYRMYFDPIRQKFWWIPTGVDYTWSYNWSNDPWYGNGNVFEFCLKNEGCKALFDEKLVEVAGIANEMNLMATFQDLTDWLEPEIQTDPRTPHSERTINDARAKALGYMESWPDDVIRRVGLAD